MKQDHILLLGPSGSGKTHLIQKLLEKEDSNLPTAKCSLTQIPKFQLTFVDSPSISENTFIESTESILKFVKNLKIHLCLFVTPLEARVNAETINLLQRLQKIFGMKTSESLIFLITRKNCYQDAAAEKMLSSFRSSFFKLLAQHSLYFKINDLLIVDEEQPEFAATFCHKLSELCNREPLYFQLSEMNLILPDESQLKNSREYKIFWQEKFKHQKEKFMNQDELERIINFDEEAYQRLVSDVTDYYTGPINVNSLRRDQEQILNESASSSWFFLEWAFKKTICNNFNTNISVRAQKSLHKLISHHGRLLYDDSYLGAQIKVTTGKESPTGDIVRVSVIVLIELCSIMYLPLGVLRALVMGFSPLLIFAWSRKRNLARIKEQIEERNKELEELLDEIKEKLRNQIIFYK